MLDVDLKGLLGGSLKLAERVGDEAYYVALCVRSGLVRPELPHRLAQMLVAFERYGLLAGAVTIGAIRHGDHVAVRDELGNAHLQGARSALQRAGQRLARARTRAR